MKAAAAVEEAEEADGGYCVLPRGKHRAEGGVIATGDERTCLPDAMSVILCMLFSIALTPMPTKKTTAWFSERVKSDPKRADGADPSQADAEEFAKVRGSTLNFVPKPRSLHACWPAQFYHGPVPRTSFHSLRGRSRPAQDRHALCGIRIDAFSGKIIDNMRGMGAIKVDAGDREDNLRRPRSSRSNQFV
eukprot:629261-Prymnesium_polylepis.1